MTSASVVGSGPNGLAAAVVLARAGIEVTVIEEQPELGGGLRSEELTLPGYLHDRCSAVHPMAVTSPFFRRFGLLERVQYVSPTVAYAHAVSPQHSAVAYRSLDETVESLGSDGSAWRRLFATLASHSEALADITLDSVVRFPRHPTILSALGLRVVRQALSSQTTFSGQDAAALLTGVLAHAASRLPSMGATAAGLVLASHAHAGGWPIPIGGAKVVAQAMIDDIRAHGGVFETSHSVNSIAELRSNLIIADVSAKALARLAGDLLPARYLRSLLRFRYGPGAAKIDVALDGPVPWSDPRLRSAVTIHVGGTAAQVQAAENAVSMGQYPALPFVLVTQPTIVDPSRAPEGRGILWAYTHVPAGSQRDMTATILERLERFAPGLRDRVLAVHSSTADGIEAHNANYVGGDISSGEMSLRQLLRRPVVSRAPWRTPLSGLYFASASAAPGPGVHGMAGYLAARTALMDLHIDMPPLD